MDRELSLEHTNSPARTPYLPAGPYPAWPADPGVLEMARATGHFVWTATPAGMITDNRAWCAYTGQTPDQAAGFGWLNALHSADQERIAECWQHALAEHVPIEGEFCIRRYDGADRDFLVRGVPLLQPDGTIREWQGFCADITDRKALERRLENQAHQLNTIFAAVPDLILIYDRAGHIVRVNHSDRYLIPADIARYSPQDIIERYDLRDPAGHRLEYEQLCVSKVLRGSLWESSEIQYRDAAGMIHAIEINAAPLRDADGQIAGAVAGAHDITAFRGSEREADQRAKQLAAIIEAITDAVFVYDPHGNILQMNRATNEMFALDRDPDFARLPPEERFALLQIRDTAGQPVQIDDWALTKLLRNTVITSAEAVELQFTALDGQQKFISLTGAPIHDTAGQITGAVAVGRDTSAHHRLDQMKDEFINIASHELRAPLTPIILAARVLQKRIANQSDDPRLQRLTDEIVRYALGMSRLVDAMLDMSRIGNDRFAVTRRPCDLAEPLRRACTEQAEAAQRVIQTSGLDDPISALADPDRIWQVLTNLLANAIKYSPPEMPIAVQVAREEAPDGARLHLRVSDRGPGIAPDVLAHLFERFYRAPEADIATSQAGLGLGLYISHAIVERHGGQIWAESTPGQGSTFHFTLPLLAPSGTDDHVGIETE